MLRTSSRFMFRLAMVLGTAGILNLIACGDTASDTPTGGAGGNTAKGGTLASSGGSVTTGGTTVSAGGSMMPDAGTEAGVTGDTGMLVSFSQQILPLLQANCVRCHGPARQSLGVRVDSFAEVSSRLTLVTHMLVDGLMPPTGGLALTDRQLFQAWVDQGAKDN